MNPQLLNWLRETLNRFFVKQPKYFKYWTIISSIVLAISGIPYLLQQFNITLPEPFASLASKAATWAALGVMIMSSLTVKSPVVGQTVEGEAIKVSDEKKMPFTAQAEKDKVEKTVPPPPVIEEVPSTPIEGEKP